MISKEEMIEKYKTRLMCRFENIDTGEYYDRTFMFLGEQLESFNLACSVGAYRISMFLDDIKNVIYWGALGRVEDGSAITFKIGHGYANYLLEEK